MIRGWTLSTKNLAASSRCTETILFFAPSQMIFPAFRAYLTRSRGHSRLAWHVLRSPDAQEVLLVPMFSSRLVLPLGFLTPLIPACASLDAPVDSNNDAELTSAAVPPEKVSGWIRNGNRCLTAQKQEQVLVFTPCDTSGVNENQVFFLVKENLVDVRAGTPKTTSYRIKMGMYGKSEMCIDWARDRLNNEAIAYRCKKDGEKTYGFTSDSADNQRFFTQPFLVKRGLFRLFYDDDNCFRAGKSIDSREGHPIMGVFDIIRGQVSLSTESCNLSNTEQQFSFQPIVIDKTGKPVLPLPQQNPPIVLPPTKPAHR